MINKLYFKTKRYIEDNYKFLIILTALYIILNIPLPYYIHSTGGIIDVSDRITIKDNNNSKGSFNLSYVSESKCNVITYIMAKFIPDWELIEKEKIILNKELEEETSYRNHLLLEEANQNALINAYSLANKNYNVLEYNNYLVYIDKIADTNLSIKDEIISIDGIEIKDINDYKTVINSKKPSEKVNILVKENGIEKLKYAKVLEIDNELYTGIYFVTKKNIETPNNIKFNFEKKESGPSGGLILSLAIYDALTEEDITKGKKIVGTGTIDIDGNVGAIGGVKYKLKAAVKEKSDIFLVPISNYDEVIYEKKKNDYDINIISISNIKEAVEELLKTK